MECDIILAIHQSNKEKRGSKEEGRTEEFFSSLCHVYMALAMSAV